MNSVFVVPVAPQRSAVYLIVQVTEVTNGGEATMKTPGGRDRVLPTVHAAVAAALKAAPLSVPTAHIAVPDIFALDVVERVICVELWQLTWVTSPVPNG